MIEKAQDPWQTVLSILATVSDPKQATAAAQDLSAREKALAAKQADFESKVAAQTKANTQKMADLDAKIKAHDSAISDLTSAQQKQTALSADYESKIAKLKAILG